ncbi:MAG: Triacylglycerol lipase [Fibrobacteres bacterium]|nr:Triacylglycerol lipase [Fibrobacterota bacterium]
MTRFPRFPATASAVSLALLLALSACAPAKKFCPQGYTIDFAESLRFAMLADQAYSPDTVVAKECGRDSCFFFRGPVSDARAFVRVDDSAKIQWIAFRGTKSFTDIKLDADYTQAEDSILHMRLHRGFAAAARDLYPLIRPHLSSVYRTRLTGHSLGGAIAVVTGLYLRAEGFKVEVETFGQPKVTNAAGARHGDSLNLIRFLNGQDLVTQVPPLSYNPGKLGSYEHFGLEVALSEGKDGKGYECLSEHYRKRYDPDSWWAQVQEQALKDHGIANYVEKLRALAPRDPALPAPD